MRRTSGRLKLPVVALFTAAALAVLGLTVPAASAVAPKALINADTVTGGASSTEATFATSLGFTVDVVDGATWDAMTQAQFAQYQLLIAGDPNCSSIADSFMSNESTWAPVVMGTAINTQPGNRVVVGSDPVLHSGGTGPRSIVILDGIDFAGAQPGRTGLYFDTTCGGNYFGQEGVAATMLAQLSAGSGTWTEDDAPPCGGNVAKIASTPKFDSLSTSDLAGWDCSVHESFPTFASDWSALAIATDTTSHPTCGTDTTVTPPADACGEAYVLIAGSGIVVVAPNISLTPLTGSDPAGGTHTVTANVTQGGNPLAGQLVTFTVTGQNNGASGTCVPASCKTDASGNVSFTYTDANGPGTDTILASFTDSSGSTQQASASETWTSSANHPPVANNQSVTTPENTPVGVTLTASDPDSNPLTYSVVSPPAHGTLSGSAPALTYTPTAGYTGPDSFTFKANDGSADSNTATVSITVTAPVTGNPTCTVHQNPKVTDLSSIRVQLRGGTLGLKSIVLSDVVNLTIAAPKFKVGQTSTVTFYGARGVLTAPGSVNVLVTDTGGNTYLCGGAFDQLSAGKTTSFTHVPSSSTTLRIYGGGVKKIQITVNGTIIVRKIYGLSVGVDLSPYFLPGDNNSVSIQVLSGTSAQALLRTPI